MFEIPHDAIVPVEKYASYLKETSQVYVDLDLLKAEIVRVEAQVQSRAEQVKTLMYSVIGFVPNEITKYIMLKYYDTLGIPEKYTTKRGTDKSTLEKKYLEKMVNDGYCIDFTLLYMEYSSLKYYKSKLMTLLDRIKFKESIEGNNGEHLVVVPYNVTQDFNRRFNTKNENIIGFYKTLRKSLKARKGYLLIGGDFPQIDGKGALNLYFKTPLMRELMRNTKDSYLVYKEFARHVSHLQDKHALEQALKSEEYVDTSELEKRISKFDQTVLPFHHKSQRDMYKVIALRTVYNSRSSPLNSVDRAIKSLAKVLEVTGRYREIKEHAAYFRTIGYPITAKSRWGYTRPIMEDNAFTMFSKLFNSPVQATSSEIIIMFVVHIMDYFRERGYGKEDICVYVNRHDEPVFEISIDLYLKHVNLFKQMSHILVHGWLPFQIEWNVGFGYKEDEPDYKELLEQIPYDETKINLIAEQHIDDPEPLTMEIPEILALSYRQLPNGKIMFVMTRRIGELPEDQYYFSEYRDSRPMEYSLLSVTSQLDSVKFNDIMYMISKMLQGLDTQKQYVVALNFAAQIPGTSSSGIHSKQFTLDGYSVFVTNSRHPLHTVNNVILASIVTKNYAAVATDSDRKYNRYSDYYSKLLTRRVV